MTLFTYTRDIPNGPNNPSTDQPDMLINTNSIDDLIGVDHVTFGLTNGGNHKQVHFNLNQAAPGLNGGVGVQFANTVSGNSFPFWQNAINTYNILTSLTSSIVTPGYIYVGSLLVQWGTNTTASGATINFPTPFLNNVFSIQMTVNQNTTNRHFAYVRSQTLSNFVTTQLDSGGSAESNTFSWIAIGN